MRISSASQTFPGHGSLREKLVGKNPLLAGTQKHHKHVKKSITVVEFFIKFTTVGIGNEKVS